MRNLMTTMGMVIATMALSFSVPSFAGPDHAHEKSNLKVVFKDFKEYSDVDSGREPPKSFHLRTEKHLKKILKKLSADLPKDYQLTVKFIDIDLAGQVLVDGKDHRVVRALYFPKMELQYELCDDTGKIVSEGLSKIKDMGFLDDLRLRSNRRESFIHEKLLLTDWFKANFSEFID